MEEKIVDVQELDQYGCAIAYSDDHKQLHIFNAYLDERVQVSYDKAFVPNSNRYPAKIIKFYKKSKYRLDNFCPYFANCSGCQLAHINLQGQREYKKNQIEKTLQSIGINTKVEILSLNDKLDKRFKSIRAIGKDKDQKVAIGLYKAHSHNIVDINFCATEKGWFSLFSNDLKELLNNKFNDTLSLRHIEFIDTIDMTMVCLVAQRELDDSLLAHLVNLFKKYNIDSAYLCINDFKDNVILKGKFIHLYGKESIEVKFLNHKCKILPNTFMQSNLIEAQLLYKKAIEYVSDVKNNDLALDLCCGTGAMSFALADNFNKVIGVDINQSSIDMALENKNLNGIKNVDFICDDISNVIDSLISNNLQAIIVDPARVGMGRVCTKALSRVKKGTKLCAIFCSLKGLKRDIKELVEYGYKIEKVFGVDMFVNTLHIETVVLMTYIGR